MRFIFQILFPRVLAQTTIDATFFHPEEGTPAEVDLIGYIRNLYTFALGIGGVLAVVAIIVGGLLIAFSGAIDKKNEGKQMVIRALWGLVLLFGSFLVLNTINPQLTALKPPGVQESIQVPLSPNLCTLNVDPSLAGKGSCREQGITNPVRKVKGPVTRVDPRTGATVTQEVERQECQCYVDEQACPQEVYDACTPQKVEIAPGDYQALAGMQMLKDCEKHWWISLNPTDKFRSECTLVNLLDSKKFSSSFVQYGAVFWRLPLYRARFDPAGFGFGGKAIVTYTGKKSAAELDPPGLGGLETAQCITVGAASYDDHGQRSDVKKLPFGHEFEQWKKC